MINFVPERKFWRTVGMPVISTDFRRFFETSRRRGAAPAVALSFELLRRTPRIPSAFVAHRSRQHRNRRRLAVARRLMEPRPVPWCVSTRVSAFTAVRPTHRVQLSDAMMRREWRTSLFALYRCVDQLDVQMSQIVYFNNIDDLEWQRYVPVQIF